MKGILLASAATCLLLSVEPADAAGCLKGAALDGRRHTWSTIHFSVCLVAAPGECMYTIYTQSGRKRIPTVL